MASTKPRGRETVGDMVRSMALVMVVVAVMILLTFRLSAQDPVQTVELDVRAAQARQSAPYDVLVPVGLGARWRAVSAEVGTGGAEGDAGAPGAADGGAAAPVLASGETTWRIGWVTPEDDFAALYQSDGDSDDVLERFAPGARPAGETVIAGERWTTLLGVGEDEGERTLLRVADGVTTIVTGTASPAELESLAAALRPA